MSKSYSRAERRRLIKERRQKKEEAEYVEYAPRKEAEPDVITAEWALERMSEDISFAVHTLVAEGHIEESQAEDYLNYFVERIVEAVPKYDPLRVNSHGQKTSAVAFFRCVLRSKVSTAIEAIDVARSIAKMEPIDAMDKQDEMSDENYRDEPWISDKGRGVASVDWRLDIEAMMSRMSPRAKVAFGMILAGYEHSEIMPAIGLGHSRYWENVIGEIRKVMIEGGYGPMR